MLTLEKLGVYRMFDGDIDGWARSPRRSELPAMTGDDWFLIDELRQGLSLVSAGRAGCGYSAALEQRLLALTADEPTRQALRELAR